MIFCRLKLPPSSGVSIDVPTNAEIRAVDMRVRAIRANSVTSAKSFHHLRTVFFERIHIHCACNRLRAVFCEEQLLNHPGVWYDTVRVRICQPQPVPRPPIALHRQFRRPLPWLCPRHRIRSTLPNLVPESSPSRSDRSGPSNNPPQRLRQLLRSEEAGRAM